MALLVFSWQVLFFGALISETSLLQHQRVYCNKVTEFISKGLTEDLNGKSHIFCHVFTHLHCDNAGQPANYGYYALQPPDPSLTNVLASAFVLIFIFPVLQVNYNISSSCQHLYQNSRPHPAYFSSQSRAGTKPLQLLNLQQNLVGIWQLPPSYEPISDISK